MRSLIAVNNFISFSSCRKIRLMYNSLSNFMCKRRVVSTNLYNNPTFFFFNIRQISNIHTKLNQNILIEGLRDPLTSDFIEWFRGFTCFACRGLLPYI